MCTGSKNCSLTLDDQPGPPCGSKDHAQPASSVETQRRCSYPLGSTLSPGPVGTSRNKTEKRTEQLCWDTGTALPAQLYLPRESHGTAAGAIAHSTEPGAPPLLQVLWCSHTEWCQAAQPPNPPADLRLLLSSSDAHVVLLPADYWCRHPTAPQDSTALQLTITTTMAGSGYTSAGKHCKQHPEELSLLQVSAQLWEWFWNSPSLLCHYLTHPKANSVWKRRV